MHTYEAADRINANTRMWNMLIKSQLRYSFIVWQGYCCPWLLVAQRNVISASGHTSTTIIFSHHTLEHRWPHHTAPHTILYKRLSLWNVPISPRFSSAPNERLHKHTHARTQLHASLAITDLGSESVHKGVREGERDGRSHDLHIMPPIMYSLTRRHISIQ